MHSRGNVRRQRPRGCSPREEGFVLASDERELDENAIVDHVLVALGGDLVLAQAGAATNAPGHHVGALVDPAALIAHLEKMPDGVVVLVREGVVRVVPVHPEAEPLRLLRNHLGEVCDAVLAVLDEFFDAVGLDIEFRVEAEFFFYLDFHPQALAVEAVLKALAVALHVAEAQEQVFVSAPPRVMNAHRVVGGDWSVDERVPLIGAVVSVQVLIGNTVGVPPLAHPLLERDEVDP